MASNGQIKAVQTPAEIRAEIEHTRQQIQASVVALRDRVGGATDWRKWYRGSPALFLGVAFAAGFYLGFRD